MTPKEFLKTDKATDFKNVAFTAEQWNAVYAWMNDFLTHQGQSLPIQNVSYCADQTKNELTNKFCNIAKEHVGETFDKVPEATDILKAIDVIEKHCS